MLNSGPRSLCVDLLTRLDLIKISSGDVRFGQLVRTIEPRARHLGDALATILATAEVGPRQEAALSHLASALALADDCPIEDELEDIVRAARISRPRPVLRYLGWDGAGGSTLQVAADEAGLSRERVRQLADKTKSKVSERSYAPALDRALSHVSTVSGEASLIEQSLVEAGLARAPFRIEGLLSAASIFGRPCGQSVVVTGSSRLLSPWS